MPAPMMPAPTTPTDLIGRGATSGRSTPVIFLVAVGEEEDVDQGPIDRRAEQAGHPFGFLLAGRVDVEPAAPSITSSAASGAG